MLWETNDSYNAAARIVQNLQVVKNVTKPADKLRKEYGHCITKNEEEKSDILLSLFQA